MAHKATCSTPTVRGAQQFQRIDIDVVEIAILSVMLRLIGAREINLTGDQLSGDAVCFLLDVAGYLGQRQSMLGTEDLLDP